MDFHQINESGSGKLFSRQQRNFQMTNCLDAMKRKKNNQSVQTVQVDAPYEIILTSKDKIKKVNKQKMQCAKCRIQYIMSLYLSESLISSTV